MPRDPRYDVLFEPVQIGPVTARNRFYQVPHCNGMGYRDPTAVAFMRGVKAEGGWAVVCTEQVEVHHSSEITPYIELRLWEDRDIPLLARIADKIHEHGSLAGLELCYNGMNGPNLYSREVPLGPAHLPVATYSYEPVQARRMDKQDIRNLRSWHRRAALRSKQAGFDLVYVYAAHAFGGLHYFLSRRYNDRSDEYGGSLENRIRLMREIVEDTKEAVGDTCGVPLRLSLDELMGDDGLHRAEVEDMIGLMAEVPDLWDLTLAGWDNDSRTSRFAEEGHQEPFIKGVKQLTTKPVVGVGRYTSPDAMVRIVSNGIVDMVGAARPSIADPYLPKKIQEGRLEDIRECIGCNICVSGDSTMSPIRCTQNPTMGGVLAELLAGEGHEVVYLTPASVASAWTRATLEQHFIQARLLEHGITIHPHRALKSIAAGEAALSCVCTGRQERLDADAVVLVTARLPNEALMSALTARRAEWANAGVGSITAIGDALAPATIAHAVYAGRRYAEELDAAPLGEGEFPFRRELTELLPL